MNEETRAAARPAVATNLEDIIGDYGSFFIELVQQLEGVGTSTASPLGKPVGPTYRSSGGIDLSSAAKRA